MAYHDVVMLEQDTAKSGAQAPRYEPVTRIPCQIEYAGGDETFRGRQLESHISVVVESNFAYDWGRLSGNMRLRVLQGPDPGMILNVEYVNHRRKPGRSYSTQFYCREIAEGVNS